jgi:cytochrome c-type biogenesis protein CcmH/NrfG
MHMQRILLASTVLALSLVPVGALAQAVNEPSATFNERYPAEPAEPQTPEQPEQWAADGHRSAKENA